GFEPSVRLYTPQPLSRRSPSASRSSLQICSDLHFCFRRRLFATCTHRTVPITGQLFRGCPRGAHGRGVDSETPVQGPPHECQSRRGSQGSHRLVGAVAGGRQPVCEDCPGLPGVGPPASFPSWHLRTVGRPVSPPAAAV